MVSALIWTTSKKQTIFLEKGYIDLSDNDLDKVGNFLLKGQWEFYDDVFLLDDEKSYKKSYLKVPGNWNGIKEGEGYGTYRCVVKVSEVNKLYGIKMPIISSAYKVYVNDELLYSNGIIGKTKESYKGYWATKVEYFEVTEPEIEIIVQVSNFSHVRGGMVWGSIEFGTNRNISQSRNIRIGISFLIFGFLIAISILHLVTYIYKRQNRASLFFGVFCAIMALRIMITGDTLVTSILFDIPIEVHAKLEYLTVTLGPLFFALYLSNDNKGFFFKGIVFKSVNLYVIMYSILIVIAPIRIYSRYLIIMNGIIIVYLIIELKISFERYLANIKGESIAFFSMLFFWFSILNDMLYVSSLMDRYYVYIGILVLVLGNTIKISIQVAKMHEEIEYLAEDLEKKVKKRTKELEEANCKLYSLATKDHLTSLYNREYLISTIKNEEEKIAEGKIKVYSVMYIDLDNFKYFNDICGHAVGDLIIKEFARLLTEIVNSRGRIFRVGGDEFLILLPNIFSCDAENIAEKIIKRSADNTFVRTSIDTYFDDYGFIDKTQRITCSIGITSEVERIDINKLINIADHSMLDAKKKGKNQYVVNR